MIMPLRCPQITENEILDRAHFVDKQIIKHKYISHNDSYVLDVFIKPVRMTISPKLKLFLAILGFILYIYLVIFLKTLYLKNKRLEHIIDMAMEAEKQMLELHEADRDLGKKIERLEEMLNKN